MKPTRTGTAAKSPDAIALLTSEHKAVKALFKAFEKLCKDDASGAEKGVVVRRICDELTVHAQVEEEIFYPAVREAAEKAGNLLDEAEVEHATAKDLIAQLEEMNPGDDLYDAKVTVLREYVDHHVQEEEGELFPKARKSDLDLVALGADMAARKGDLRSELGLDEAPPSRKRTGGPRRRTEAVR